MNPVASPRHPWKAFFAVIAMFALVHAARAHVFGHDHDASRIHVVHAAQFDDDGDDDSDCPDVDVHLGPDTDVDVDVGPDADAHFGPNFPFDDDTPAAGPVEHDWD